MEKNGTHAKFIYFSILCLPILFVYSIGISSITFGDLLLMLSFCLGVADNFKFSKVMMFFFLLYILIQAIIVFFVSGEASTLLTSVRYSFYILCIAFLPDTTEWVGYINGLYTNVCVFSTVLAIVQTILYRVFNIILPGVLLFLPLTDETLYDYRAAVQYTNSRRCMSCFGEPSHYALFVLPCLLLCLMNPRRGNKEYIFAALISVGVIATSSFTGIIGLVFVILLWLVDSVKNGTISQKALIVLVLMLVASVFVFTRPFIWNYIANSDILSRQSSGRFNGYSYLAEQKFTLQQIIFGNGMYDLGVNAGVYLPGLPRMFYYYGLLGCIFNIAAFASFCRRKSLSLYVMLLFLVMSVGTEVNFMPMSVVYLLLADANKRTEI